MSQDQREKYEVTDRIFTIPNALSFIRLCMIPLFFVFLLNGYDIWATLLFALAASTDWVDGQIARHTNSVSRLGQLLDPAVDRLLMISGVVGLLLVGRLPFWIIAFVVIRDLFMLAGGVYLLKYWKVRVAVIFLGKVATTCLYVGFAAILLNWPICAGLGLVDVLWLPGLSSAPYSWGIWFVYIGLFLAIITTVYYIVAGVKGILAAMERNNAKD